MVFFNKFEGGFRAIGNHNRLLEEELRRGSLAEDSAIPRIKPNFTDLSGHGGRANRNVLG